MVPFREHVIMMLWILERNHWQRIRLTRLLLDQILSPFPLFLRADIADLLTMIDDDSIVLGFASGKGLQED